MLDKERSVLSLEYNIYKLFHMLDMAMKTSPDWYERSNDMPNTIVFRHNIVNRRHSGIGKSDFIRILANCGYQASFHRKYGWYYDTDIWVTPVVDDELIREGEEYFHVSVSPNLCATGIRLRSRLKDNEFDVYTNRIYLGYFYPDREDIDERAYKLMTKCREEHGRKRVYLYKVSLPKCIPVYQDPTLFEGCYITHYVHPSWISRINIVED